jgi:hypothetical protein
MLGGTLLVVQLVEALRYKPECREFDSRRCRWNFDPEVDAASRNVSWG